MFVCVCAPTELIVESASGTTSSPYGLVDRPVGFVGFRVRFHANVLEVYNLVVYISACFLCDARERERECVCVCVFILSESWCRC